MIIFLLVGPDKKSLSGMLEAFDLNKISIEWAQSGETALSMIADKNIDLVVADEKLGDMTGIAILTENEFFKLNSED